MQARNQARWNHHVTTVLCKEGNISMHLVISCQLGDGFEADCRAKGVFKVGYRPRAGVHIGRGLLHFEENDLSFLFVYSRLAATSSMNASVNQGHKLTTDHDQHQRVCDAESSCLVFLLSVAQVAQDGLLLAKAGSKFRGIKDLWCK
eukprot:3508714-Amphidinium_carterae.1